MSARPSGVPGVVQLDGEDFVRPAVLLGPGRVAVRDDAGAWQEGESAGRFVEQHGHDLDVGDWRTCLCGRVFGSARALHSHTTRSNRAASARLSDGAAE